MFEGMHYLNHTSVFLFFQAAFYYYHAASSCHPMAQYRYARYLLHHRPENGWDRHEKAVTFLEQAAMAGVTEVSVNSMGIHRREPVENPV